MCYNEVSVENEIILGIFAEKGPYNMTMWFVVPLIVTDTYDLTHDLDPWFSRSNFEKVITQERDAQSTWNERDVSRLNVGSMLWLSTLTSPMTWTLNFQRQILKLLYPRNGRVDRHGKGCESIGCYTYFVTLSYDFDLGFWRSNLKKSSIIGIRGWIDIQGYESIGCSCWPRTGGPVGISNIIW